MAKYRKDAEEFLAKREDTSSGGTSWERISKLVDLSGKGAKGMYCFFSFAYRELWVYANDRWIGGAAGGGKEKFKQLLVDLKKDPNAPGASGYGTEVK